MSGLYKLFLASGMLVFGSINTITTKTADMVNTTGRPDFPAHPFTHPYLQALGMFLGEFICLIIFYIYMFIQWIKRWRVGYQPVNTSESNSQPTNKCNPFIFILPAMCDMCATSTVYFGLNFTYASSFQMLRGSVIIFTTVFSMIFLRRSVFKHQWFGIIFVIIGLTIVGLADVLYSSHKDVPIHDIIMGDTMIVLAQIITAIQMCVEEKFISGDVHPLQAVGWEGFWGAVIISSLLYPLSHFNVGPRFAPNTPYHTLEDVTDGLLQMKSNHRIIYATAGNMMSIACFNFFGLSVTKNMSATTRMVLDSMRTIVIWSFSIGIGWQEFVPMQIFGFLSLFLGMAWFNKIILPKALQPPTDEQIVVVGDDGEDVDDLDPEVLENTDERLLDV